MHCYMSTGNNIQNDQDRCKREKRLSKWNGRWVIAVDFLNKYQTMFEHIRKTTKDICRPVEIRKAIQERLMTWHLKYSKDLLNFKWLIEKKS